MSFDHSLLDRVVKAAVKDRLVDYAVVEKMKPELDKYLDAIAKADVAVADLAFYVDAYNARVLRSFLAHGKKRVVDVPGFFTDAKERVAGEELTLNELEEKKLRRLDAHGISKDPRVHFVVNCASLDCPPLANFAYTAANIDKALDARTRAYLTKPNEVKLDDHRIVVVQIFEWYATDFAGEGGVRRFIAKYVPALKDKLLDGTIDLDYRPYDWTPNAA
jgi:hypothetical protein